MVSAPQLCGQNDCCLTRWCLLCCKCIYKLIILFHELIFCIKNFIFETDLKKGKYTSTKINSFLKKIVWFRTLIYSCFLNRTQWSCYAALNHNRKNCSKFSHQTGTWWKEEQWTPGTSGLEQQDRQQHLLHWSSPVETSGWTSSQTSRLNTSTPPCAAFTQYQR